MTRRTGLNRSHLLVVLLFVGLIGVGSSAVARPARQRDDATLSARSTVAAYVPAIKHVFVINIENKGYDATWGPGSKAPYLAKTLRQKGVLLNSYYGTAHNSQPNYVAQISGQGPNPDMQADCQIYSTFVTLGTQAPGQAVGVGCVFPTSVHTIAGQLVSHGLRWRGYMGDMVRPCQHPTENSQDPTQKATATDNYAARHNPFVYFKGITGLPTYCRRHVVPLTTLPHDLAYASRTPNLVYITPDLCEDGHDAPCADGRPGGLVTVNAFMKTWVPRILNSPAFKKDGVLIITADESDGPQSDATACCGETAVNTPMAGIVGAGGGRIGALVISRWTRPNTWSATPYNHYSLLASMEEIFRLSKLGYARTVSDRFGLDVYNNGWQL
jgi:hypothetical protein